MEETQMAKLLYSDTPRFASMTDAHEFIGKLKRAMTALHVE
jgi:hypothetical protein